MIQRDPSVNYPETCPIHEVPILSKRIRNPGDIQYELDFEYVQAYKVAHKDFRYSGEGLLPAGSRNIWVRWIDKKYCPACVEEQRSWRRQWLEQQSARRAHTDNKKPNKSDQATPRKPSD
jgi:hypothetical protein